MAASANPGFAAEPAPAAGTTRGLPLSKRELQDEERRKALRKKLVGALVGLENFVLAAKHFVIPENSVVDKLPHFRSAVEDPGKSVVLSEPFQAYLSAKERGLPEKIAKRPKHKFLVKRKPSVAEVFAANLLLCWSLTKLKI